MPISVDLEKNPLLRGMVEHVRRDCMVDNIAMVLRGRFGKIAERPTGSGIARRKISTSCSVAARWHLRSKRQ